jgi:predicted RNA-binding protein with TRAM domain
MAVSVRGDRIGRPKRRAVEPVDMDDGLRCLFSGRIERRGDDYVVEVPASEVELGTLDEGGVYRFGARSPAEADESDADGGSVGENESAEAGGDDEADRGTDGVSGSGARSRRRSPDEPPVETGELREVEIEDLGEQGDGLARVGPGYVVFVPDAGVGDRVRVRITDVRDNFAFAEIAER